MKEQEHEAFCNIPEHSGRGTSWNIELKKIYHYQLGK